MSLLTQSASPKPAKSKKRLAAAIALLLLLAIAALFFALRPHGSKAFLITGIDNYGLLTENGRSDVIMLVQVDFDDLDVAAVTFARDMFVEGPRGERRSTPSCAITTRTR